MIIDADVAARAFALPREDDFAPVWEWIENGNGKLVFGSHGKLGSELRKLGKVKRRLLEMWRAGQALQVKAARIDQEEKAVAKLGECKSNDIHVVALARASGARVLCTHDHKLETDFKNPTLVSNPRGKIYKTADHRELLGHNSVCIGRPRRS
ncbi:MAG: hypothetical protein HQ582_01835 [Planctomycetes bacterium]|nr:hypothetical protein [Planctomycetota bacterium]